VQINNILLRSMVGQS